MEDRPSYQRQERLREGLAEAREVVRILEHGFQQCIGVETTRSAVCVSKALPSS